MTFETYSPASFCTSSTPIAVVGVSDRDFGGAIYKTLKKRGYIVYAVNPKRETFDGDKCVATLGDLPRDIKHAIVAVSPEHAERVVDDAVRAGFTHLWFQQGKNFESCVARAKKSGIAVVSRKCILMYTEPIGGIHGVHRLFSKALGRY